MRVLLTNDDGVQAEGLLVLRQVLSRSAEVTVLAPDRPRSACGHSVTLHKPLRVSHVTMADGSPAMAATGTPTDCVMLALRTDLLPEPPDLVISGINNGPNLGWDLTYSGTVSGAMEAAISNVPAISVSSVSLDVAPYTSDAQAFLSGKAKMNYEVAAEFIADLAVKLLSNSLPKHTFLNVNVPSVPKEVLRGVQVTRQGIRRYSGMADTRTDPMGNTYYWLGGDLPEDVLEPGADVHAVANGYISVTPIQMDLTAHASLDTLRDWDFAAW